MGKVVKASGRSSRQQRRENGDSYRKQAAKSMGRSIKNSPPPPATKRRG